MTLRTIDQKGGFTAGDGVAQKIFVGFDVLKRKLDDAADLVGLRGARIGDRLLNRTACGIAQDTFSSPN